MARQVNLINEFRQLLPINVIYGCGAIEQLP